VSGAFEILTGVDALPVLAPLGGAAVHVVARAEAQTQAAGLTLTTVSVALTEPPTRAIEAELLSAAGPIEVHHAVAVVVDAVTHLHGIHSAAAACVPQPLVDPPVAVIVHAIADLFAGDGHRLTEERALDTHGLP